MEAQVKPKTGFLDLPAELRNWIYSFILVEGDAIRLPFRSGLEYETVSRPPEPGLLAVSRQVHSESMSVYYGENTFRPSGWIAVHQFLKELDKFRLAKLRTLQMFLERADPVWWMMAADLLGRAYSRDGLRKDAIFFKRRCAGKTQWEKMTEMEQLDVVELEGGGWRVDLATLRSESV